MQLSREKFVDHFWPCVQVHVRRSWWVRRKAPPTHAGTTMYEVMASSGAEWSIPLRRFSEIIAPIIIELYAADRKTKPDPRILLERVYDAMDQYQASVTIRPPFAGHSRQVPNLHSVEGTAGIGVTCNACQHRDYIPTWALARKFIHLRGNMTELGMIRFRCTACDARWTNRKSFEIVIFYKPEEIDAFIKGRNRGESAE